MQNIEGRHLLLHLPVLMHALARIEIGIICLFYTTVQELKYSQQPFPKENVQLHSQVVVAQNSLTTRKMA